MEIDFVSSIQTLLGQASPDEKVIEYWAASTKQYILNYCNLKELPEGLYPILVEMTCLRIRYNTNGVGTGVKNIASVSDGSQSVSYALAGQRSFSSDDDLLNQYKTQLNRFRRLKW